MAWKVTALAMLIAAMGASPSWAADRVVPTPNPGFEAGDALPEGWTPVTSSAQAVFIWDRAEARSGERSLYMRNYGPRWAIWRSDSFAVRPEARYRLAVWAKIRFEDAVSPSRLYLRVRRGRWTRVEHVTSGAHGEWRRYSLEFETDPGVDTLHIELSNLGGRGTEVWFDDLELTEIPRGE